ncbi:MAG: efflux RND transporter permease subunit [Fidelibacterota bacterium]
MKSKPFSFLKYPALNLVIMALISLFFFRMMKLHSRMETDLDKYMPQTHPAFVYSNLAEDIFNIRNGIIIAIENPDGIYNTATLDKIKNLTRELGKMPEINKNDVTSLYTVDNIIGTEGGMDVKSFYKRSPNSPEKLADLRKNVRHNEMVFGRIVSDDETVSIIVASIDDDVFSQQFYRNILKLVESFEGPEKLYVAGTPIVEGTMAYLGPQDMKKMVPIVIVIITLVLLIVLRSFRNTIFTLLVVLLSTVWTFGLMAMVGIPIYAVSTMIPVMLIAIGVAYGIHLYSHLDLYRRENPNADKGEAVTNMLKSMWKPVLMTSVTTAVGFSSLLTSEVYPIKYFGIFTAFGVMLAMGFSLVLIPSGILVFGMPRRKPVKISKQSAKSPTSFRLADAIVRYKILTPVLTAIIIVIALFGIGQIWINSSFLEKFEKDSDIVLTDQFINEHFGGTSTLNVIIESDDPNRLKQPDALKAVSRLQSDVETLSMVGNSFTLADYLQRMNKVMHSDDDDYNIIPDSKELIAQYLLLYEMSGDPDNLWKVVDYHYTKANLTFQIKSDNSRVIKEVLARIENHRPDFEALNLKLNYAGSGYKALVFTDLILEGQIKSLVISLFIIIILLSVMFRKVWVGLIGSIPIILTALISFGIMGLLNIPLSTTTALLSSIAMGIGIDYAVHFIERFRIYAAETGDKTTTIRLTMQHSGRAIAFNAMVVIAGFLVLLFSVFPPNRQLGALVSLNMFTSFLGTLTIMLLILAKSNLYFKTGKELK